MWADISKTNKCSDHKYTFNRNVLTQRIARDENGTLECKRPSIERIDRKREGEIRVRPNNKRMIVLDDNMIFDQIKSRILYSVHRYTRTHIESYQTIEQR